MSIFDGLLNPAAIGQNALEAFEHGRRQREERDVRGALSAYAVNPDDPAAFAQLAQYRPEMAIQLQETQRKRQQQAEADRRSDLPLISRLLEYSTDPQRYAQARAVAQEYGIDLTEAPEQFDPAWIEQQRATLKMLQDPAQVEALSTAGKQAVDMGYKPNTPEFNKAVRAIWRAGEAKPYVVGGETRLYQPDLNGPGQALGAELPSGFTIDEGGPAAAPQAPFVAPPGRN